MFTLQRGLVLAFVLLVSMSFSGLVVADVEYPYGCFSNEDCSFVLNNPTAYCSQVTGSCFIPDVPANAGGVASPVGGEVGGVPAIPGVNAPSGVDVGGDVAASLPVIPGVNDALGNEGVASFDANQLVQLQLTLQLLQEQSASVEDRLAAMESGTVTLSQGYQTLQTQLTQLQSSIDSLQSRVQKLESEQVTVKESFKQEVRGVSTGLATLQSKVESTNENLDSVQQELDTQSSKTTWLTVLFVVLLVAGVGIGIYIYMNAGAEESVEEVDEQILKYITKHIKAGKKFPQVKDALLKAGWAESDINWAYKETLKKNYQSYLAKGASGTVASGLVGGSTVEESSTQATTGRSNRDKQKSMVIGIVGIVILIGLMFLVKSVGIGQAIHFGSQEELSKGVHDALTAQIAENPFYSELEYAMICVQVLDEGQAVSYRISKTPFGHEIMDAPLPCDQDIKYDASFKFSSFDAFDLAAQDFSCENVRRLHRAGAADVRGVVVLPSRLVMPGFVKNPTADYGAYCPVISECLSAAEKSALGIVC